jgi:hypothetical protein
MRERCPRCGADPDTGCVTTSGRDTTSHMARVELARFDRGYGEGPWAP